MSSTPTVRCQASKGDHQCIEPVVPGTQYCERCGKSRKALSTESIRQYNLASAEVRAKFEHFLDQPGLRSLREEIALVRILIERLYNRVEGNDTLLLSNAAQLNQLFLTLERLVKTTHQQEQSLGELLTRDQVVALARQFVEIVIDEIAHFEGYEAVADRIVDRVSGKVLTVESKPVGEEDGR